MNSKDRKTVLNRNLVLFFSFKKPYLLEIRTNRNRTNRRSPVYWFEFGNVAHFMKTLMM